MDINYGWVKSYLSDRVKFNQSDEKENASLENVNCGVPQGSI